MSGRRGLTVAERFWLKVDKSGECWLWTAAKARKGYGHLNVDGKGARAHRVSYEMQRGPIPPGMQVCHRCDTPACVRPDHLFLGTNKENSVDMHNKGRGRVGYGERHGLAKLTVAAVIEIRRRAAAGEFLNALAREFKMSRRAIGHVCKGATWTTALAEAGAA